MVQLIAAIEAEARNLMKTIKKFKEKRKRHHRENSSDFSDDSGSEESETMGPHSKKGGHHHKVTTSIDKICGLEKEIKQICSRISSLNHCLNDYDTDTVDSNDVDLF